MALSRKPHPNPVSIRTLRQDFLCQFGVNLSRCVMTNILRKQLGATYGRYIVKKDNFDRNAEEPTRLRHEFLQRSALMLRLETEGTAINVGFDESYIHTSHTASRSWSLPDAPFVEPTKGRMLIILHAMTQAGWVTTDGPDGRPLLLTNKQMSNLKQPFETAEMLFMAKAASGDYHDNMDSATYLAWLEFRLFPTLRKKFPGKRYFLWLDNAKYHKTKRGNTEEGKEWVSFSQMNKTQLCEVLSKWGVESISVVRTWQPNKGPEKATHTLMSYNTHHTFTKEQFSSGKKLQGGGPSNLELLDAVKKHSVDHPEYFTTLSDELLERLSLEDSKGENKHFHQFNYTPPNEGFVYQSTEEGWGITKSYVALSPEKKNKQDDLIRLTREGLYGVEKDIDVQGLTRHVVHEGVPCAKLWRRVHDQCSASVRELVNGGMHPCCAGKSIFDYKCSNSTVEEKTLLQQRSFIINLESESDDSDGYDSDNDDSSTDVNNSINLGVI
jgi:hypothetical protein